MYIVEGSHPTSNETPVEVVFVNFYDAVKYAIGQSRTDPRDWYVFNKHDKMLAAYNNGMSLWED